MNVRFTSRGPVIALLLTAAIALAGCASFSPDSGMAVVSDVAGQTIGKDVAFVRSADDSERAGGTVRRLLGHPLTVDAAVQIARERFRQAQLRAALETLRLAADVRRTYYRTVAANEMVGLLTDAKSTAESTAQLAKKLGETGSLNKLDQAREQVFYAETTAELASARQEATSARERLTRLMGLWGDDLGFRLPDRLSALPRHPRALPTIEADAVGHRIDLQIARMELTALEKSLGLTQATRFVTLLDVAGIAKRTSDPDSPPFRERGFDIQFQIPVFDGGEVRVRQAAESYNQT